MALQVDWSKRAAYIRARHAMEPRWADEAVRDRQAVWLVPDPASQSGRAVRVIGYSVGAGAVVTVILVDAAADQGERPDGDWWGSNAWLGNSRDRSLYGREKP